jgi:hypothetical protein
MWIRAHYLLIVFNFFALFTVNLPLGQALDPPADRYQAERIWLREHGTVQWLSLNSNQSLALSSPTSKLDIAYVIRSPDPVDSVNVTLILYRNSETVLRFNENGSLLAHPETRGWFSEIGNLSPEGVCPFRTHTICGSSGEYHKGYIYYLFTATLDPDRYAGIYQVRVNLSGIAGGSSWQSPDGNPNLPWTFFELPSDSTVSISPFLPGAPLRASSRVNVIATGQPSTGIPSKSRYEIFIDDTSWYNGTCYGSGFSKNGRQLPRNLPPGEHTIRVLCGEVLSARDFLTDQWPVELDVSPNVTIPGGSAVTLVGSGFPENESYSIYLGQFDVNSTPIAQGAISRWGNFSVQYAFPKEAELGTYNLTAVATQISGSPFARTQVALDPWSVELNAYPSELHQGEWLQVNGSRYPTHSRFELYLDGSKIHEGTTDENGSFHHRLWTLDSAFFPGTHILSANATEYGGPPCGRAMLAILPFNTSVALTAEDTYPGSGIRVDGFGFPPNSLVEIRLDSELIGEAVTSRKGKFTLECAIPEDFPLGSHLLIADAPAYAGPTMGSQPLEIVGWPVQIDFRGGSLHPGGWIEIAATGLPPNSNYEVDLNGTKILESITGPDGEVRLSLDLPINLEIGQYTLELIVPHFSGPPKCEAAIRISEWSPNLDIAPLAPRPGELLMLTGDGYPRDRTFEVSLDGVSLGAGLVSSEGEIQAYLFLARNLSLGGHTLNVSVSFPGMAPAILEVEVSPWKPFLNLTPRDGPGGSRITLSTGGFPPSTPVSVHWDEGQLALEYTNPSGTLDTEISAQGGADNGYHRVMARCERDYSGSPSAIAYFWYGSEPPYPSIYPCDPRGDPRFIFFPDQVVYCTGDGFPPSDSGSLHVLDTGDQSIVETLDLETGPLGDLLSPILTNVSRTGTYRLWADYNSNLIIDSNDVLSPQSFQCRPRPNVRISSPTCNQTAATKGTTITLRAALENLGPHEEDLQILFRHGEDLIASIQVDGLPGHGSRLISHHWDTSSTAPKNSQLIAETSPLMGELDTDDNRIDGPMVRILPPPEITILSMSPDRRKVKSGGSVRLETVVRNSGQRTVSFDIELIWGEDIVLADRLTLGPGTVNPIVLDWNTTGVEPGLRRIRVRTEPIPWEGNPNDNDLASGRIEILPPNSPPEAVAGGPYEAIVGLPLTLDGSGSRDDDGSVESYMWQLGDGSNTSGARTNHTYIDRGHYTITLTVTDNDGDSSSGSALVEVLGSGDIPIWPSGGDGRGRNVFDSAEDIYATVDAPGSYEMRVYMIATGSYSPGSSLAGTNVTDSPIITDGISSVMLSTDHGWKPGRYDLVLDMDLDHRYDPARDARYSSFVVGFENGLPLVALLILPLLRRRTGPKGESDA